MNNKHKIIGLVLLLGLPLLVLLSAPNSKKQISATSASDVTSAQSSTSLSNSGTPNQSGTVTDTPNSSQATSPTQTPVTSYSYTPVTPTIAAPKPATPLAAPTSSPSAWTNTTGFLSGTYHYVVTYVPVSGQETGASPASLSVSPNGQRVWVTNIPTSSGGEISERNLYRTLVNSSTVGPYYLVTSFYDNITTNYYDNTPDNVLIAGTPKYF